MTIVPSSFPFRCRGGGPRLRADCDRPWRGRCGHLSGDVHAHAQAICIARVGRLCRDRAQLRGGSRGAVSASEQGGQVG